MGGGIGDGISGGTGGRSARGGGGEPHGWRETRASEPQQPKSGRRRSSTTHESLPRLDPLVVPQGSGSGTVGIPRVPVRVPGPVHQAMPQQATLDERLIEIDREIDRVLEDLCSVNARDVTERLRGGRM